MKFVWLNDIKKELNRAVTLVDAKWVLRTKRKSTEEIDKLKARVVARGFTQRKGIDYNETFASTARSSSWRILIALATVYGWKIHQFDFVAAYLAGVLDERIFIKKFDMLAEFFTEHLDLATQHKYDPRKIIELQLPLYGLKQSGRSWQKRASTELGKLGFKPLATDLSIYYNRETGVILASYVDDFLIFAKSDKDADAFKTAIAKFLPIKDLGLAEWFLGVKITQSEDGRTTTLTQEQYIDQLLKETGFEESRAVATPMEPGALSHAIRNPVPASENDEAEITRYASLVGKVIYATCMTRMDVAYAAGVWARFMANPTEAHASCAERMPRYLQGTRSRGIQYKAGDLNLHGMVDADYAGDRDNAKSTTGWVFYMAGGPVSWCSKLQSTVAQCTSEAEYVALTSAAREAAWIREFLTELNLMPEGPIQLFGDNVGANAWASTSESSRKKRHIRVAYHYIEQEVRDGHIAVRYIRSEDNIADGLTKPLNNSAFQRIIRKSGMTDEA